MADASEPAPRLPRLLAGNPARWSLQGFRAVITGSTKGIGHACATEMVALGAEVVITARSKEEVDRVTSELIQQGPGKAHGIACDVSTAEGRAALLAFVTSVWDGVLDGLVNNVGTNARKPIQEATDEEYSQMMGTNIESCWYLCKIFKPLLQNSRQASVVNVGSVAGVVSSGTGSIYAMTKAAMAQLSRSLGCEWGPLGIRVNCVCPWMTLTPLLEEAIKQDPKQVDEVKRQTPLSRLGNSEDTAGMVAFLCMPAAAYVTGQVLCVDGGLTAQGFRGPCVQDA